MRRDIAKSFNILGSSLYGSVIWLNIFLTIDAKELDNSFKELSPTVMLPNVL